MVISSSPDIIKVERQGKPITHGFEGCKSMKDVFAVALRKWSNTETEYERQIALLFQEQYKRFHPDKEAITELGKLKGESPFEIIKDLDKWTIITYQVDNSGIPKQIKTTATKQQLTAMIDAIIKLSKTQEWIPTSKLAEQFLLNMGIYETPKGVRLFELGESTFDKLYSWRGMHNCITRILDAFREEGIIEYKKSGETRLINKNISLQLVLN